MNGKEKAGVSRRGRQAMLVGLKLRGGDSGTITERGGNRVERQISSTQ